MKTNEMKTVTFLAPNQCYFYSDGQIIFQSYSTIVALVNETTKEVEITDGQPQSKTTAKYLNKFLNITVGVSNYKQLKK